MLRFICKCLRNIIKKHVYDYHSTKEYNEYLGNLYCDFQRMETDVGFMMMGVLMSDINNITLSGRLVKDSILSYSSTNLAILNFSIANIIKVKKEGEWKDNIQLKIV
ncbi:Single-strand DNA binding protein (plasmid) [Borrelia crocidurae DOU]|uniref:Single-strand DNA binding protein n=2 Tax=Borrelia crocidurae TaxID=29520 RepID=W5SMV1_9SPIR|nr:Single-strand DNA binding protein [Borrelia crocidurae DOU]